MTTSLVLVNTLFNDARDGLEVAHDQHLGLEVAHDHQLGVGVLVQPLLGSLLANAGGLVTAKRCLRSRDRTLVTPDHARLEGGVNPPYLLPVIREEECS